MEILIFIVTYIVLLGYLDHKLTPQYDDDTGKLVRAGIAFIVAGLLSFAVGNLS